MLCDDVTLLDIATIVKFADVNDLTRNFPVRDIISTYAKIACNCLKKKGNSLKNEMRLKAF